ncbi:unnamed protein product [Rhizopus stolonifer]
MAIWLDNSIEDLELRQSVKDLIKTYPESANVIERLVTYYNDKDNRQAKRLKVDQDSLIKGQVLRLSDVSFQSPARKKYDLIITTSHLILYNPKLEIIESQYLLNDLALGVCLPTPEKTNKSFTFALFPKNEEGIVFNTQDKVDIHIEKNNEKQVLTTDKHEAIVQLLTTHAGISITQPSREVFNCKSVDSKEEKAYVVAYLKAKDGFLFFLPTGILFGFKKPTLFIPTCSLSNHAVTSITQRTFDLVFTIKKDSVLYGNPNFRSTKDGEDETIEFSMISQEEYAPIDAYIKQAGVNDQSMSEERRAVSTKKENDDDDDNNNSNDTNKNVLHINNEDEDSEADENFEPSDNEDDDPLEYDTDAEEEEEEGNNGTHNNDEDDNEPLSTNEIDEDQDMLDESD